MDRNRGLDINALRQQLEDLFEDLIPSSQDRRRGHRGNDQTQHLALNVAETDEAFTLTAPLPGFQPEDVDVTVRGQNVSLRAQHKTPPAAQENLTRHEWGQGAFQRSFELPHPVDADSATATFRQGVVTVTLPKAEPSDVPVEGEDEQQTDATPEETAEAAPEDVPVTDADAAAAQPDRSSFYMAPGRGRRGRRHGGKNAEPPADERPESSVEEEQTAGSSEGEIQPQDAAAPADEPESRAQDRDEQSGFDDPEPEVTVAADASDEAVAETLIIGGETPEADAGAEAPAG